MPGYNEPMKIDHTSSDGSMSPKPLDLAKLSEASLQAIKNLENGGNVELVTFLRVAGALGMTSAIVKSCQPSPTSLDEIERIEAARSDIRRVRVRP